MNKTPSIKKAVFLDLDGVLFDTVKEAYCVCCFATNRSKAIGNIDFDSEHFRIFKKYRYLITCAKDYYPLLKSLEKKIENKDVNMAKEFKSVLNFQAAELDLFERRFFEKRKFIRKNHFNFWLSLNEPKDFLFKISPLFRKNKENFFIITTKDKESVARLLKINEVSFLKRNIYDGKVYEKFNSKGAVIKSITYKYGLKRSVFVDDSKEHLFSCRGIQGLDAVQAGWGYAKKGADLHNEKQVLRKIKRLIGV